MSIGVGERIKSIRVKAGLGQKELGKRLGVSTSAISAYEREDRTPTLEALIAIAQIGETSLDWLLTGRDSSPRVEVSQDLTPEEKHAIQAIREVLKATNLEPRFSISDIATKEPYNHQQKPPPDPQERQLIEIFRKLHPAEKEKVIEIAMLYAGAKEPRKHGGGENGSQESNCA